MLTRSGDLIAAVKYLELAHLAEPIDLPIMAMIANLHDRIKDTIVIDVPPLPTQDPFPKPPPQKDPETGTIKTGLRMTYSNPAPSQEHQTWYSQDSWCQRV
jgi:hypothetical protein